MCYCCEAIVDLVDGDSRTMNSFLLRKRDIVTRRSSSSQKDKWQEDSSRH